MHLLFSLLYLVFVNIVLLIPGYGFVKRSKFFAKTPALELCLAYCASLCFFALLAFAHYILSVSPNLTEVVAWAWILIGGFIFLEDKQYVALRAFVYPLLCFFLMSVLALAFILLPFKTPYTYVPDPSARANRNYNVLSVKVLNVAHTRANDNYVPYRQAQFMTNRTSPTGDFIYEWGVSFFERTPLTGAVTTTFLDLFAAKLPSSFTWSKQAPDPQHTYLQFQILAQTLNGLLILPAFFLLRRFFDKTTALVTLPFIVTSQFFLYNEFFTWPKSLAAFFIMTMWLLLEEKGRKFTVMAGIVAGLAYLTHDLSILYIAPTALYLLLRKRVFDTVLVGCIALLFAIPWVFTAGVIYNNISTFIYYPFSTHGIPNTNTHQIMRQFLHTSVFRLVAIRADTLYFLLAPYQLLHLAHKSISDQLWAVGVFSVPGAIGLGLVVPAVLGFIKKYATSQFVLYTIGPIVACALLMGWPQALGALHFAEAAVALLMGLGVYWLLRLARANYFILLAYALSTFQLVFFVIYSYGKNYHYWTSAFALSLLVLIAFVVIACEFLLVGVLKKKRVTLFRAALY